MAVAGLLPLLFCSEEAATHAFINLSEEVAQQQDRATLQAIAKEEEQHQEQVEALIDKLPSIEPNHGKMRQARRFHAQLGRGSTADRLASVAGVDSATCLVISHLFRSSRIFNRSLELSRTFRSIHRDEAKHVQVSRLQALGTGESPLRLWATAETAREGLSQLLLGYGDEFEGLGIDTDRLTDEVRTVPRNLFAA